MIRIFVFLLLSSALQVFAYSEMIRHHYVNCSACHVSQTGGAVLNSYGRSISQELLSTWGAQAEARAMYTMDPETVGKYLQVGGDIRGLQTYYEDVNVKSGRGFIMQAALEAAVTLKQWTAFMTFGEVRPSDNTFRAVSPRYFLSYQITDEFSLRAGKLIPQFGLQIPQHNYLTRSALSLVPGGERHVVEAIYNGELWNFALSGSRAVKESFVGSEEVAVSTVVQRTFNDSHKAGVSFWMGDDEDYKKSMIGLHGVLGLTEKFYLLTEVDQVAQTLKLTNAETKSVWEFFKAGYEVHKGVHLQAVQQYGKLNVNKDKEVHSLGAGIAWYPRPHFEIETLWSRNSTAGATANDYDYGYIMGHFYF